MNKQHSLIWDALLYKFKLGNNSTEATKTNCWELKDEDAVDHIKVTRWFEKLHLGCKNFEDQAK